MNTVKIIVGIIHVLLSVIMIALILLQTGKRAGMAGVLGGSADTFYGKNKTRTMDAILSRFTKICAIGFLVTSLFLAYGDTFITSTSGETGSDQGITATAGTDGAGVPIEQAPITGEAPGAPSEAVNP